MFDHCVPRKCYLWEIDIQDENTTGKGNTVRICHRPKTISLANMKNSQTSSLKMRPSWDIIIKRVWKYLFNTGGPGVALRVDEEPQGCLSDTLLSPARGRGTSHRGARGAHEVLSHARGQGSKHRQTPGGSKPKSGKSIGMA